MATPITSVTCLTLNRIDGTDCIGDSRQIINNNITQIGQALCTLTNNTITTTNTDSVQHIYNTGTRLLSTIVRDNGVTANKLATNSVTTDKIALSAVGTAQLSAGAVTQNNIALNVAGTGPAFRAYASSTTSVSQGVPTKVTLDTEQYDTNNNFSSSRFTPTIPGYYQINFNIRMEAKQDAWALLYKNVASFSNGSVPSGLNYHSTGSDIVYLNGTGDYVELWAVHQSAGSQNVTAAVMSGFLARSA